MTETPQNYTRIRTSTSQDAKGCIKIEVTVELLMTHDDGSVADQNDRMLRESAITQRKAREALEMELTQAGHAVLAVPASE